MGLWDAGKTQAGGAVSPEIEELDRQASVLEQKKQEMIAYIGQLYVDSNDANNAAGTIFEEPLKEVRRMEEEIDILEKRKLAVQGLRKCEKCGNILVLDSLFCNKCGERLEELFPTTELNPYICEKCGKPYDEGMIFCTGCGNKLK
ncbi:MAG: zinc ribbon domain-containing protein [Bacteroidales bacterium]|nr:zinc ribbon domain-containing protein [Lachnoclostridium sp.]MCM1385397.1 zinc ribbon domain-containing protein [Lachnoclostridium sp.]MCM1464121.1 zinc ribbon domain-containing protein [Bacteroidales bacterium]